MEQGIIGIVQQSPRLKSIEIANQISPTTVLTIAHGANPTLQELEFRSLISAQTTKSLLKDLPQHITKLHLSGIEDWYGFDKDNGETPFIDANDEEEPINHYALTSLHLCGELKGHEEYILLPFLTTCSTRLTNFQTTGIGCYRNKKVHDALSRLNIHMETIQFRHDSGYDETAEDAEIASIFALSRHMKVVDLYRCSNTGPQAIAAILGSADHLECLYLPCHNQVSAADLQAIISQAKKLRTLTMYFPGMWCGTLPALSLSAAEFLAADWASSSLERFGCVFRVPRPNDHVPQEHQDPTWNNPTLEHSRQIQRQVYRHLAKQTHLYEVYLGALLGDANNPQHLWYSLEMTLESGLDELVDLKNLSTLTLHNMNHRMGAKELNWICSQWPELRSIDGLCVKRGKLPADIEEWRNEQLERVRRHRKEGHEEQLLESARRYGVIQTL
ncbi:hypothetical protein CPB97_008023 [Podila verticillata]|nr:hypothetical protein CPB97_008023 [Podila verticillata]